MLIFIRKKHSCPKGDKGAFLYMEGKQKRDLLERSLLSLSEVEEFGGRQFGCLFGVERGEYVVVDVPFGRIVRRELGWCGDADGDCVGVEDLAVVVFVFFGEVGVLFVGELTEAADGFIGEARCFVFVELFDDGQHHVYLFLLGVNGECCRGDVRIRFFIVEFFFHLCADGCVVEVEVRRYFFFCAESEVETCEYADDEEDGEEFSCKRGAFFGATSAASAFSRLSCFFHMISSVSVWILCLISYHIFGAFKRGEVLAKNAKKLKNSIVFRKSGLNFGCKFCIFKK